MKNKQKISTKEGNPAKGKEKRTRMIPYSPWPSIINLYHASHRTTTRTTKKVSLKKEGRPDRREP